MKKIIMLVMAAVMALTAFGCSNSDNQSSSSLQTGTVAKDNSEVGASKADPWCCLHFTKYKFNVYRKI